MTSKVRILIIQVLGLAALAVFWNLWTRAVASPAELRAHISFLALGYALLIGIAVQELARTIACRSAAELRSVTVLRLIAAGAATIGYLSGFLWAIRYGRHDALQRPVLLTDSIVVGLAWFVAVKPLRHHSTANWDFALGLGALSSWFIATLS